MDYTTARAVLRKEDEILDSSDTEAVLINNGSLVHQAIKTLARPTVIEHLIETGAVTYADIFGTLQANGRDVSPEKGKQILLAPYKEPPVVAKLSDKECELLLSLMHDGYKLETFRSSAILRTLKKFTNIFVDARDDDTLGDYFDRHYDQISDYCERMERKILNHILVTTMENRKATAKMNVSVNVMAKMKMNLLNQSQDTAS